MLLAQRRPPDEHAACATLLFGPLALPAAVQGHCCGLQHHGVRPGQESSIDTISTCRRQTRFRAAFISDARKCAATWHNRVNSVQSTRECLRRMLGQQHWDSSPNSQSHRPTLSCASLRWHACPVPCRLLLCHYRRVSTAIWVAPPSRVCAACVTACPVIRSSSSPVIRRLVSVTRHCKSCPSNLADQEASREVSYIGRRRCSY